MKHLDLYIQEKLQINKDSKIRNIKPIKLLSDAILNTFLLKQNLKDDDFIDWHTGMLTIYDINKDHSYYDLFLKEIDDFKDLLQFKSEYNGYKQHIGIKEDNTVCVTINFNDNKDINKANIINIDISKNLKELLINKGEA
jgi:hypothetical protein